MIDLSKLVFAGTYLKPGLSKKWFSGFLWRHPEVSERLTHAKKNCSRLKTGTQTQRRNT